MTSASGSTPGPTAGVAPRWSRKARQRLSRDPPPTRHALGPDADAESVARTILLDQLTGRARSRRELADKLASRDVPPEIAERLLDRFTEVGLIDDEAFARSWVSARQQTKGLAKRALSQELRRKGVDDEVVREVLDEVDPDAEDQAARLLVRKKLRSLSGSTTPPPPAGWSACSPARATAPAWPSRWSRTS